MRDSLKILFIGFVCFFLGVFVSYEYSLYGIPNKDYNLSNTDTLQIAKEETLKDEKCVGDTEEQLRACLETANKDTESNIRFLLSTLKESYAIDETELWKITDHSQQVWTVYRDARCDVDTYYSRDGTAYSTYRTRCLLLMNQDRSVYLQKMIENP